MGVWWVLHRGSPSGRNAMRAGLHVDEDPTGSAACSLLHLKDNVRASYTAILTTVVSILSLMQCVCVSAIRA